MKKIAVSIALALIAIAVCGAQDVMTMEEAVLGRGVSTKPFYWHWTGDKTIVKVDDSPLLNMYYRQPLAYVRDNNLYCKIDGQERAITTYSDPAIVCGQSVSRNEFGIDGGIFISPDSSKVAFYKKDESRVSDYALLDIFTRSGSVRNIKYPMNGMPSEIVSLGVYDIASDTTVWMKVSDFDEERYLTNISWDPTSSRVYIQVLSRSQKEMHLNCYDANSGECLGTLLTETNERFVEPQWPLHFLKNDPEKFIYTTDNRHGYKNLYLCSVKGGEPQRLTSVDADVEYVGQDGRYVYYYSAEVSPLDRQLFRVDVRKGKMMRLTQDEGQHRVSFSSDMKYFVDQYTSLNVPMKAKLYSSDGKLVRELFTAPMPPKRATNCIIETGTLKSADGQYDNYYSLVKPADFDPAKKYPLIIYVYGGPHSQLITNRFQGGLSRWDILMAQKGYVVATIDNRGTPNRGAMYEKAIHRQCGKVEMEDQMVLVDWLRSQKWIDSERIGVHGWSYGGFMTISLMTHYPDVFKVGVAGGPVIDWKWYEVMYGERYMETEATNPEGFKATSLIGRAPQLKGKLLICQGVIDDTVVWQHSLNFVEACIKAKVQVDYFPYPSHPHNVRGTDRVHLMNKVTDYFDDYLK